MSGEGGRTPQELAGEALERARTARSSIEAMAAITSAIVALAGEVHALGNLFQRKDLALHVREMNISGITE